MAQCPLHHGWLVLLKTGACCGLSIFFEVTTNWRAGCQKLACPVRREGRPESSSLPLSAAAKWLGPFNSTVHTNDLTLTRNKGLRVGSLVLFWNASWTGVGPNVCCQNFFKGDET